MHHLKVSRFPLTGLGRVVLAVVLGGVWIVTSQAQTLAPVSTNTSPASTPNQLTAETVVLPKSVPDPLEPLNRVMWAFNKALMTDVIKPTSKVYRFVVVKPVRTGIGNFGKNLTYPGRLINNLLQGKWSGARDESYRFVCNTTVGVAGFFDVASKWKIPKSDADFGQTFGQWGWKPECFLMLPVFGPSNERDTVGLAADTAANPLIYIAPYKFVANDPLTYLGPYTYLNYAVMYNDLADSVGEYVRFSQAEMDPYSEIQYAWTFARANRVANFQVKGKQDEASLETLESVFFTFKDPEFPSHGKTRSVLIPATGRKLKFTFWLQPGKANVVYIVPGLGSHRLAETSLALAELVYKNGFSAVCVSSPFNYEFMEHASTAALPAYLPVDGHDLHVALTEIDRRLHVLYPDRLGNKALMGYSMGAFQSLFIAATEPTNPPPPGLGVPPSRDQLPARQSLGEGGPLIQFDRFVAINTPVRMAQGISKLDEFYRAPLQLAGCGTNRRHRKHLSQGGRLEQKHAHAANLAALQRHRIQVSHRTDVSTRRCGTLFSAASGEIIREFCITRSGISGASRCIRKFSSIPTRIILRSLRFHIIRPGASPRRRRKRWKKPVTCGHMKPVCAPIPTSASSSIKTIFS